MRLGRPLGRRHDQSIDKKEFRRALEVLLTPPMVRSVGRAGYSIFTGPIASFIFIKASVFTLALSKCDCGYCRES